jgi:hypothetical protein
MIGVAIAHQADDQGSTIGSSRRASQLRRLENLGGADLLQRHDVKAGVIPERLWRKLYIRGMTPQKAADQAAASAKSTLSPADRLKRR